jgi:RNA polymerase sigma factor (TIGR02999 family)
MNDGTQQTASEPPTGEDVAVEKMLPVVYSELRRLAARKIAMEAPGNTLQATALVHEAWMRIVDPGKENGFNDRTHFVASAAQAMRRILVESARRKKRLKRGGQMERVDMDACDIPLPMPEDDLLALDEALDRLAQVDRRSAEVVKLRYFAGLTQEQVAEALDVSLRSVERSWKFARAWLFREVKKSRGTRAES